MKIKPISFGKAVKVYAPYHVALKIANGTNELNKPNGVQILSPDIQKIIKDIFNDTDKGHALPFYFNQNKNSGYILSGNESREYQRSLYIKALEVRKTKLQDPLPISLKKVLQSKLEHNNRTKEIIENSQEDFALKITKNGEKIDIIPRKK
jgi:hypothetical protein